MQMFSVVVRVRQIDGFMKGVYEEVVYTGIYANTAEEAIESVVYQKNVDKKDIKAVQTEIGY